MRNLWLLFLVGLATGFISEKLLVSSQSSFSTADDLYLEGRPSGDLPIDDEDDQDGGSGSGSGDYALSDFTDPVPVHPSKSTAGNQDQRTTMKTPYIFPVGDNREQEVPRIGPTADWFTQTTSPSSTNILPAETTFSMDDDNNLERWDVLTPKDSGDELLTEETPRNEEFENEIIAKDGRGSGLHDSPEEVTSENMWERTEVLAAVIACGVVGFLCAVFLLLLLAYRMKKKDEGSYDLGDTKLSTTAYQKAPTKEFYA